MLERSLVLLLVGLLMSLGPGCSGSWDDDDDGWGDDDDGGGDDDASDDDDDDDTSTWNDADGDGWESDVDCDDTDPALNWSDSDGDGVATCPEGGDPGDCDDADADNYPGNPETCDGSDNDCDGSAEVDGDGVCGMWSLIATETTWTARELNPALSPHAPSAAVQAAFTVADVGKIWVLTGDAWHVMSSSSLSWLTSGGRDELFPELSGVEILAAMAIPEFFTGLGYASIYLYTADFVYTYTLDVTTDAVTYSSATAYDETWGAGLAPPPADLAAAWLDLDNANGWVTEGDPLVSCGLGTHDVESYVAYLTVMPTVHLFEGSYCYEFFHAGQAPPWSVFAFAGAPSPAIVGATTFTGATLVVFGP